jgi:membrane fusion protein (multidrug efflux system)
MRIKRVFAGVLILVLTLVVIILILLPKPTRSVEQGLNERTTDVSILEIQSEPLSAWLELPASVEPSLLTEVSAEVEGRISWIGPEEGDVIEDPGTLLLRIDERTFRAQFEEAQAAYELSSKRCNRIEELHAEGVASKEQLDQCQSEVASNAARFEIARIQLEKAVITAPSAGVLNKLYFEVGEYVRAGEHVADIVVIDPVKVLVKVPEKDIPYVHPGKKVEVSFDFLGEKSYEGTVTYISVVGEKATRTYDVEITVPNPDREILPSMIATVKTLKTEIPQAITIPLFAVLPRGDFSAVFVEENGRARERLVEFGILEGSRVQIVKGIEPNDRLIVEGQRELADGDLVRVRRVIEPQ